MSHKQHIGQMIKEMRIHRGMTQADLAKKMGRQQHHISDIENGKRGVSIDTLVGISNALKCYLDINMTPRE